MRAGTLDTKILILNKEKQIKGPGNVDYAWLPYWQTMANKKPLKASRILEVFQNKLIPGFTLKFRSRIDKTITESMKIEIKGIRYTIQEMHLENNNQEWTLNVIQDGSQGA